MGRYDDTLLKFNKKGQRVLVPTLYPDIPLSDEDQFVYPKDGERLENIAFKYYGDVSLWWIIAAGNPEVLSLNSLFIPVGTEIRIPSNVSLVKSLFNSLNRI